MAKRADTTVEDIRPTELPAFRRSQRFENAKNVIQIAMMVMFAVSLFIFLILLIISGVSQYVLPDTEGVRALSKLFVEIAENAKTVALFALGFFFREYLSAKLIGGK